MWRIYVAYDGGPETYWGAWPSASMALHCAMALCEGDGCDVAVRWVSR